LWHHDVTGTKPGARRIGTVSEDRIGIGSAQRRVAKTTPQPGSIGLTISPLRNGSNLRFKLPVPPPSELDTLTNAELKELVIQACRKRRHPSDGRRGHSYVGLTGRGGCFTRRGQRPMGSRCGGLGRRQVVRQRVLVPPSGGSNPPAPASRIAPGIGTIRLPAATSRSGSTLRQSPEVPNAPIGQTGGEQQVPSRGRCAVGGKTLQPIAGMATALRQSALNVTLRHVGRTGAGRRRRR
jgi:hypothetical protein